MASEHRTILFIQRLIIIIHQLCILAGTAIGQNHVPNLHFIDQGPEDGVELDNLLLERRSSTKSFTSRRSSSLSRKESLPTVQVIPPSVTGGNIIVQKS